MLDGLMKVSCEIGASLSYEMTLHSGLTKRAGAVLTSEQVSK